MRFWVRNSMMLAAGVFDGSRGGEGGEVELASAETLGTREVVVHWWTGGSDVVGCVMRP